MPGRRAAHQKLFQLLLFSHEFGLHLLRCDHEEITGCFLYMRDECGLREKGAVLGREHGEDGNGRDREEQCFGESDHASPQPIEKTKPGESQDFTDPEAGHGNTKPCEEEKQNEGYRARTGECRKVTVYFNAYLPVVVRRGIKSEQNAGDAEYLGNSAAHEPPQNGESGRAREYPVEHIHEYATPVSKKYTGRGPR